MAVLASAGGHTHWFCSFRTGPTGIPQGWVYRKPTGKKPRSLARESLDNAPPALTVLLRTLEDETGNINLVVWKRLAEKQRRELLRHFLGRWENST
ncbi:MAG: hypothetical protein Ct9H300mP14_16090 [Gammaproteobacteria bacterium]|nr:MAG: hypothetical protein Ct9H300mP14_16090 [Gammaproteobacteria bacterium]